MGEHRTTATEVQRLQQKAGLSEPRAKLVVYQAGPSYARGAVALALRTAEACGSAPAALALLVTFVGSGETIHQSGVRLRAAGVDWVLGTTFPHHLRGAIALLRAAGDGPIQRD